jgi:hypothetical protein
MPILINWKFVGRVKDAYTPPELSVLCLEGEVYSHPKKQDGTIVTTSKIMDIDLKERKVTTRNNDYTITGPPDAGWVEWLKETNQWEKYESLIYPDDGDNDEDDDDEVLLV